MRQTGQAKSMTRQRRRRNDNLVGEQLGDYKLLERLATGGMARIYLGEDIKLGRRAAIKVLTSDMVELDETLTERFQREAKAVAALDHPNIVPIYQYGEVKDYYFLAMKLIEGEDLADELNRYNRQKKLIAPKRLVDIMEQIASALDYAHQHGIIHRDVKPSNILLDGTGRAYLTDFGLVLRQHIDKTMGTAFGTPRYISPEQALASETVVTQSDVYSLAVIVYEALTGHMVFKADTAMQIALSHISEKPPPPRVINPAIPRPVEREVLKALSKEPEDRHPTAGAFIAAVKEAYGELLTDMPGISPELIDSRTPAMRPAEMDKIIAEHMASKQDAIRTSASPGKRRREASPAARPVRKRAGSPVLVLLSVIFMAVITGAAWMALTGDGIDLLTQGLSTTPPALMVDNAEATPEATEAVLNVPLGQVTLHYNTYAFALRNDNKDPIDLNDVRIAREDGSDEFDRADMARHTLNQGECLFVLSNSSQAVEVDSDWKCASSSPADHLRQTASLFWLSPENDESFIILMKGEIIATCPAIVPGGSARCETELPLISDG